jgi:hypothetical protein
MRRLYPLLLAAVFLHGPAAVAQLCVRPVDQAAFDVAGLKSQLMVTALTCDERDKYNSFVMRFRAELMGQERALQSYFGRAFGNRGVHEHDDYITSLANAQSQAGLHDGTLFCRRNAGLLDEVLSLPGGATLAGYAATKGMVQPVSLAACVVPLPGTQVAQARGEQRR